MDMLVVALVVSSVATAALLVTSVVLFRKASREEDTRIREMRNRASGAARRAQLRNEGRRSPYPGW